VFGNIRVDRRGAEVEVVKSVIYERCLGHRDRLAYLRLVVCWVGSLAIDKPVSMLSFTIQSPDSKIQSHGTWFNDGSENSNTSPGTKSWEDTERPRLRRFLAGVQIENQQGNAQGELTESIPKNANVTIK
jgi:hypothetical protein